MLVRFSPGEKLFLFIGDPDPAVVDQYRPSSYGCPLLPPLPFDIFQIINRRRFLPALGNDGGILKSIRLAMKGIRKDPGNIGFSLPVYSNSTAGRIIVKKRIDPCASE